jgi:hypothetical protein
MSKRGRIVFLALSLSCLGVISCAKSSRELRLEVRECVKADQVQPVKKKNPQLAAALGFVFGGGSFYTRQWELGILDAAFWPLSMAWDPLVGFWGAERINDQATLDSCRDRRAEQRKALASPTAPKPAAPSR